MKASDVPQVRPSQEWVRGIDAALPDVFRGASPASATRSWDALIGFDPALPDDLFATTPRVGVASSSPPETGRFGTKKKPRPREDDAQVLEPGAIVDKYRIEALIGRGGFAHVYRATHLGLGIPVALKMLRTRSVKPEVEQQLVDEARNAARIDHPNVVRVMDVTHTAAATYIVMEYIDGDTLASLVSRLGRLTPHEATRVGLDVVRGLAAGLEKGLVHRDIKPANILVNRQGHAKIVDLGLARRSNAGDAREGRRRGVVGTPGYIAPEQFLDPGLADFRSDIYALGVTLFESVVGRPPFPTDELDKNRQMHLDVVPPPAHELAPDVPTSLSRLLSWMLAKDPAQRPFSYPRLLESFEQVAADLDAIARRERSPGTRRKRIRTMPK